MPSSQLRPAPFRLPHLHSRAKTAKMATRRDPPVQLKDATHAKEPSESDPESLTKRARRGPLAKLGAHPLLGWEGHRATGRTEQQASLRTTGRDASADEQGTGQKSLPETRGQGRLSKAQRRWPGRRQVHYTSASAAPYLSRQTGWVSAHGFGKGLP